MMAQKKRSKYGSFFVAEYTGLNCGGFGNREVPTVVVWVTVTPILSRERQRGWKPSWSTVLIIIRTSSEIPG